MTSQIWLEQTTTTLDEILRVEYGVSVERAVLAHVIDRRCENLARALHVSSARAESIISDGEVREVALHIALTHGVHPAVA